MAKAKAWILFLPLIIIPTLAWAWSGMVMGISDGDTIKVMRSHKRVKVRLYGIDCPERGQAFGKKAMLFTSSLAYGKIVEVETVTTDSYRSVVGIVYDGGRPLNEDLVKAGFAWVYTGYCERYICNDWKEIEAQARKDKRGLWADCKPVPPWEFRRKKRKP
ncbi:MAG: thermonuclease family protein [Deltaproteobacteria bacterium]|nr:MAG: thermonuclease family protein [Deltaproteobacteria bacterium]